MLFFINVLALMRRKKFGLHSGFYVKFKVKKKITIVLCVKFITQDPIRVKHIPNAMGRPVLKKKNYFVSSFLPWKFIIHKQICTQVSI